MADRAQVSSLDAIEMFRANLIIYLSKARPTLEEISADVSRTSQWLQNDQRRLWQGEMRARKMKLERAQAELFSSMMSKVQEVSAAQQLAVRRCKQAVQEAEEKMKVLEKWDRDLENRSEPLVKQVDQLHSYITSEMPRAIAYLDNVIKAIEAYADVAPPGFSSPSPTPTSTEVPPAPSSSPDESKGGAA